MIRKFEPSDMNRVCSLVREHAKEAGVDQHLPVDDVFFTKTVRQILMNPANHCFVAEQDGTIIGYSLVGLITKLWNPTLYGDVYFFYIHNSVRNKYIADSLFAETVKVCKEAGAGWMEWSVSLFDKEFRGVTPYIERASAYFEHKGAEPCGEIFVYDLEDRR